MTKKKYDNGVESGKRYHYDVFEVRGDLAYHIAPTTTEYEAERIAEALAALDIIDVGVIHDSVYVVRARPTVAHNIHRMTPKSVKRTYDSLKIMRDEFLKEYEADLAEEPTKTSIGPDDTSTEEITKKIKSAFKRKKKAKA